MARRKSCPVCRRPVVELLEFNPKDKSTYNGTETVRGLNKFQRRWFRENAVSIVASGKTHSGRTFVVPYKDINGIRYWILDKLKCAKNIELGIVCD